MASFFNSQSQEKEGSDDGILCANNCGFFGCSETMNLCSICYKLLMKNQNNAKAEEDGTSSSSTLDVLMQLLKGNNECKRLKDTGTREEGREGEKGDAKLKPNRCTSCKKHVGLTGFQCRCGDVFCGLHRYVEEHNCPYDYRNDTQQSIAKNNPVIKPKKFQKF
ncbi:hypothetical protein SUGI_0810000 [Cryptomeria japonica]|nr:hypothetical protein SUGI_0810000 [Cryptomeria japonica]